MLTLILLAAALILAVAVPTGRAARARSWDRHVTAAMAVARHPAGRTPPAGR